jgi:steroid delta-isomerase-like uncharacterized protein
MSDTETNKKLVKEFFETVVNERNVDALPKFVAPGYGGVSFTAMVAESDPTRRKVLGVDRLVPKAKPAAGETLKDDIVAFQDFTQHVLDAFPDIKVHIESIVAEDDQVAVRWTAEGTHRGEFLGIVPTGRVVPMTNAEFFTLKDGKIVEVVSHPDGAGVLRALGHLPDTPLTASLDLAAQYRSS